MKKIIYADDDPEILEVVKIILADEGFEVETTTDPYFVLNLSTIEPALILLDIRMSGVDGRDICKKLKLQSSTKNIPIILISANKDTQRDAINAGTDGAICKPFELDELVTLVKKYVKT